MNFHYRFIFRFRSKNVICVRPKCYVRNWTVTKFCDIGNKPHRWLSISFFGGIWYGISFSSAFSFTAENERWIFGRPLHQTVSDYTIRQWFSSTRQSQFRTACRCLEKLVLPYIFDTSLIIIIIIALSEWPVVPLHDLWRSQVSTA